MRTDWVSARKGQANVSQMHYARKGVVTEEMACLLYTSDAADE